MGRRASAEERFDGVSPMKKACVAQNPSRRPSAWRSMPTRHKLFLILLAVSIIPTVLMTVLGSIAIYDRVYELTILLNTEGLSWSQEQLRSYADEIHGLFYALELDRDFKQTVVLWNDGQNGSLEFNLMRERLLTQLNRYGNLHYLVLLFPESDAAILAERSGVRLITKADEAGRSFKIIGRHQDLQTNLFFKRGDDGPLAIHDMRRFGDQSLVVQIQAGMRPRPLEALMRRLVTVDHERIAIQNDEGELIATLPEGLDRAALPFSEDERRHWVPFYNFSQRERLSISKVVPRREISRSILPTVYGGLLIGLLSAVGAVGASAFLSGAISKPLARLADRVKNIELHSLVLEGDEEGGDEISLLELRITGFVERIRQLIRDEYDTKLQAKLAQIDALQAQINPHFLHNTLQLIGSVSLAGKSEEAYKVTAALSGLMRYSMAFDESFVSLDEELRNLEHYLTIQRERFSDRFTVDLHVEPQVRGCLVPKLTLQPLVENAFRHGFKAQNRRWELGIAAFLDEDGKLLLIVRDNGAGMSEGLLRKLQDEIDLRNRTGGFLAPLRLSEHIGLLNTNDRIRLAYAPGDGLRLRSQEGEFTEVSLRLEARGST